MAVHGLAPAGRAGLVRGRALDYGVVRGWCERVRGVHMVPFDANARSLRVEPMVRGRAGACGRVRVRAHVCGACGAGQHVRIRVRAVPVRGCAGL